MRGEARKNLHQAALTTAVSWAANPEHKAIGGSANMIVFGAQEEGYWPDRPGALAAMAPLRLMVSV